MERIFQEHLQELRKASVNGLRELKRRYLQDGRDSGAGGGQQLKTEEQDRSRDDVGVGPQHRVSSDRKEGKLEGIKGRR